MGKSKVTEYLIHYLDEAGISREMVSEMTGIQKEKLMRGYEEPLFADEFLRLCAVLKLEPEKISSEIKKQSE